MGSPQQLIICVSSGASNAARRRSLRNSWFRFKHDPGSPLPQPLQDFVEICFVISRPSSADDSVDSCSLLDEQEQHKDILFVDAPDGYHNLWRKALVSMQVLQEKSWQFYMHADDDSYVRLDLLMPLLAQAPHQRYYWGYIWDGTENRVTAPIRNPRNKSYMPAEQYPLDFYPPFASGCGFVLSRDLVQHLLAQPLPNYRLLDPPFGIHLCGSESCVVPGGPVAPVHDPRVRPYRGIPIFDEATIVQHYLRPEEMKPFHQQALAAAAAATRAGLGGHLGHGASTVQLGTVDGQPPDGSGSSSSTAAETQGLQQRSVVGAAAQDSGAGEGPGVQQAAASGQGAFPAHELYAMLVGMGILRR